VSSPSGVRDGAPAENGFGALYSCQKAPRSNHFEYFEVQINMKITKKIHVKNFRGFDPGNPPP